MGSDDAVLLAAASDSNENLVPAEEPSEKKPKLHHGPTSSPAKCYKCKQKGHWAGNCPGYSGAQEQNPTCYQCGEPGHRRSGCPQRLKGVKKNSKQEWHEPD